MKDQAPPPGYRLAATPTRAYNCNFRSQLEARWAVFFSYSQIPWKYEPQSVDLPDGRSYLPDFVVWDSIYCEVKPYAKSSEKALAFAVANPGLCVLLLAGIPDYRMHQVLGAGNLWAGFYSNGRQPLILEKPDPVSIWSPPTWQGTDVDHAYCSAYLRARGFAHTCSFKNGAVKIPKRIQQLYATAEEMQA